ncbi:MAG: ATP-binding domain-containing protein, partial [Nitrospirae bacterium]|nr:ATP-binding domain-containing protein [Nitrospirota bacterium]
KPNWNIAVVFQTRSLYQQFKDLIRRFSFDHYSDEPDWGKLKILHAWGSNSQPGLYSEIADKLDFPVRDFKFGMTMYGRENAFEGVCNEILDVIENKKIEPFYDAILIDEAQDLPIPFFKIIYKILSHPKRVIWAYDELQNLTNYSLPSLTDLFGTNDLGNPNVILENPVDGPRQDIILPICYRNTSWALTLAHALGFGINRAEGLVQICDDELWNEIGYKLIEGEFVADKKVSLKRKSSSSPEYFSELLSSKESVTCYCFNNFNEEVNWIADQIYINIKEDELDYDDILIILPDALTAKKKAYDVIQALRARKIPSHLAGVTSSVDEIFLPDSVAIANIYRAKGNEAPMVYIANSDYCNSGRELIKLRNSIFTAITRSRAWVRIVGSGTEMKNLEKEFNKLVNDEFVIKFTVPDESMRESLRTIHRELTAGEKANIKKAEEGFEKFLELVDKGDYDVNTLPIDTKKKLERILRG